VRGKLVDQFGQMLAEAGEQLRTTQAGMLAERLDGVLEVAERNLVIRPGADPELRGLP